MYLSASDDLVVLLISVIVPRHSDKRISKSQAAVHNYGMPQRRVSTAMDQPIIAVSLNDSPKRTSKLQKPDDKMVRQLQEKAELPNETNVDYR